MLNSLPLDTYHHTESYLIVSTLQCFGAGQTMRNASTIGVQRVVQFGICRLVAQKVAVGTRALKTYVRCLATLTQRERNGDIGVLATHLADKRLKPLVGVSAVLATLQHKGAEA
jgi:hypothetical protein